MKDLKRVLSFVLCMAMLLSVLPVGVITARATEGTDAVEEPAPLALEGYDPITWEGEGTVPTTEKKSVYKLTSSLSSGTSYLIVNSNSAGSGYALANNNGSVAATAVTVKNDSNSTYIELADATDELWTVGGNSSRTFVNDGSYLGYTSSGYNNYTFGLSTTSRSWTYSSNRLSIRPGNTTYYLRYNNGWTWTNSGSASGRNVYFYAPGEIDVPSTTTASGTYAIAGNPASVSKVVVGGETVQLGSKLTFTYGNNNNQVLELDSSDAVYSLVEGSIATVSEDGLLTFSGEVGTAVVMVSCEIASGTVTNYISVEAVAPEYVAEITDNKGAVVDTIPVKSVTEGMTLQLGSLVTYETEDGTVVTVENADVSWDIPEEYEIIATVDENGLLTFSGIEGTIQVDLIYTTPDGETITDTVTVIVSATSYIIPEDGTNDFPGYPAEGAIRHDKTATAVGSFSQTGVAKVELSMTGVPYSTNNEIDVVIMVDMSTSMTEDTNGVADRVTPARNAANDALTAIVQNTDDTINNSRVALYTFNGYDRSNPQNYANAVDEVLALQSYQNASDKADLTKLNAAKTSITNWITESNTDSGTNYGAALEKCYSVLKAAKEEYPERKQYVIFVTDGEPTTGFAYETSDGGVKDDGYNSNYSDGAADKYYTYTEYYSKQMKAAGVEVYTVGIQLDNDNANTILKKIAGNSTGDAYNNSQTHGDYAQFIDADEDADKLTEIFTNIVNAIKQAATDVIVADQITDDYTMIFEAPTGSNDLSEELANQKFYIDVTEYTLEPVTSNGVITDYKRAEDPKTLCRLYLKNNNGTYVAASDSDGAAYPSPVFEEKAIGTKYYWTTEIAKATDTSFTVNGYYFTKNGNGEYNMTSGGYANGTRDAATETSNDLIIATPYFVYNAKTRMLYWTAEKLSNTELALSYFLYLDNSATEIGTEDETEAGTYPTNVEATLTYTNFQDNLCQQKFPVPQLTWKGAQVSYVFYLVNSAGQPVNRAGRVIPFSEAVYVTDTYTESVVWNAAAGVTSLNAETLASTLVPSVYDLYDENAYYEIDVFEAVEYGADHFIIEGGNVTNKTTTKVFNTKAGVKYDAYGAYSNTAGSYESTQSGTSYTATVTTGFDYCNTTVAFAVVWNQALTPDTVVVDFGLDVVIDVISNDTIDSSLVGIRANKPMNGSTAVTENSGVYETKGGLQNIVIDEKYDAVIEGNAIRFSQNDMLFDEPAVFYYESGVRYYEGNVEKDGYMYSPVTVVPATTIYYEEEFVDFASYTNGAKDETSAWIDVGTAIDADQAQDRPGDSAIGSVLDADNNYGYDQAYENMSIYSMGAAKKITVDATHYGEATFSFYGTGFDVISLTDSNSGTITIEVFNEAGAKVKTAIVDTYYGMDKNGSVSVNNPDAIYQVPVMKIAGLDWGKYSVKITAAYNSFFDHAEEKGSYDLYLDAIRIYDPAGDTQNSTYVEDGEGYPVYTELRNNVIAAQNYSVTENGDGTVTVNGATLPGVVFIDCNNGTSSTADYISYGPNNELYLANNQAIAFNVTMTDKVADVQLGIKVANGAAVTYEINGERVTVESMSDLYYSILDYAKAGTVTIKNVSGGILSLTNIKVTYTEEPTTTAAEQLSMDAESVGYALMSLRSTPVEEVPEETVPEETLPEQTGSVEDVVVGLIGKFFGWIFD